MGHCYLTGHEGDRSCVEVTFGEEQGTCGRWQVGDQVGEASCDHCWSLATEDEEHRRDPFANGLGDRAYLGVVDLDLVDRCEA